MRKLSPLICLFMAIGLLAGATPAKVLSAASRTSLLLGTGAISGVVYFDANGDGVRDVDETGTIEGATLNLSSAGGGPVLQTFETLADGAYSFGGLDAGTYVVAETDAFGYVSTTSNTQTIAVGTTTVTGVNFGDTLPFTVTGIVYQDQNGDGTQGPTEVGLGSVPVELYDDRNANSLVDAGDVLLAATTTDGLGVYYFYNVMPGYRVVRIMPPGGSGSPSGNDTALQLIGSPDAMGAIIFVQNFPLLPVTEPAPACAFNTSILSRFSSSSIPAGRTIWLTARLKASGLGTGETTVYFDNQMVQYVAGGASYHVSPFRGKVTFSPTATATTTSFNAGTQTWETIVSQGNWDKEVFLSGLAVAVPVALPGNLKPITWSGRLEGTKAGLTLEWAWAAAVYTSLSVDNNALGVKAVSGNSENPYPNGDKAGTPEKYKEYVVAGARGGGGANHTGDDTGSVRGLCITPAAPPYQLRINCGSVSYTDSYGRTWSADTKYYLGAWGYLQGTAKSASGSVANTGDDFLYLKYREAPVEYRLTVPNDTYYVTLKFAEFVTQWDGERKMHIRMEDVEREAGLDILASAGKYNAFDRTYPVSVTDGLLNIVLQKAAGSSKEPVISAIEVVGQNSPVTPTPTPTPVAPPPTPAPTATPIRYAQAVNSGSTTYTDGAGGVWSGDKAYQTGSWGYTGGAAKSSKNAVAGATEDALYQAFREKPGEYRFTVPNGVYDVTLKFAELVANNPGERVMNISIEGSQVEVSLDVLASAGKNNALDRTYSGIIVQDGLLNISFLKVSGSNKEPIVSAVKVVRQ